MSNRDDYPRIRLTRDQDRRMLFGVCAGLARYFGFDLTITRVLVVIAALFFPPTMIVAYILLVLLMPKGTGGGSGGYDDRGRPYGTPGTSREAVHERVRNEPHDVLATVRYRFRDMDARLQRLEKYVTSNHFRLDAEFRKLKE